MSVFDVTIVVPGDIPVYELHIGPKETKVCLHWLYNNILSDVNTERRSESVYYPCSFRYRLPRAMFSFQIKSTLDIVDQRVWTTPSLYLKQVDRFNDLLISCYLTTSRKSIHSIIYSKKFVNFPSRGEVYTITRFEM